jgi:hypothetical protein
MADFRAAIGKFQARAPGRMPLLLRPRPAHRAQRPRALHAVGRHQQAARTTLHRLPAQRPRHHCDRHLFAARARAGADRRAGDLEASGTGNRARRLHDGEASAGAASTGAGRWICPLTRLKQTRFAQPEPLRF